MARRALLASVCIAVVQFAWGSTSAGPASPSSPVFNEYEGCSQKCEGSYSPHTSPNVHWLKACKRGCRLSLIATVSGEMNASSLCHRGCSKAYSKDLMRRYACEVGCSNNVWDRTYKEMLEQELLSYMMMASFMQRLQDQFLNSFYWMHQPRSFNVYVAADGSSGVVYVSGEMERVNSQLQYHAAPTASHQRHHRGFWCHLRHYHWFHWILMLSGFAILAFFVSTLLDFFTCGTPRLSEDVESAPKLPKKKGLIVGDVSSIKNIPVVPPGKLVEVVITEV